MLGVGIAGTAFTAHAVNVETSRGFWGWQPGLVAAGLGLACLAFVAIGVAGLRHYRSSMGSTTFQVPLTVASLTLGTLVAGLTNHADKRALQWAEKRTSTYHAAVVEGLAVKRRILGTVDQRPTMSLPLHGVPAPATSAAPLIRPADLGDDWFYDSDPGVILGPITPLLPKPLPVSRVLAFLATSHWTGELWQTDEDIHEHATRYASTSEAMRSLRAALAQDAIPSCGAGRNCAEPGLTFATSRVGDLRIWREVSGPDNVLFAYVLDGALMIDISAFDLRHIGPEDDTVILSGDQILRAAIRRLELADRSK